MNSLRTILLRFGAIFVVSAVCLCRVSGQTAVPTSGLRLWLQADVGVTSGQNNQVSVWADQSGLGNDASQTTGTAQPAISPNSISGLPAIHFSGGQFFSLPNFMSAAAAGEMFAVLRIDPYDSGTVRGFMRMGSNGDNAHYPIYGGVIADNFGSTTRMDTAGTPEQDLSKYHIYNALSTSTEWTSRINGLLFYTTQSNTVGFSSSPRIGLSDSWYFAGDMAEILVYDRKLSDAERGQVISYLGGKYPDIAPLPAVPTNLKAVTVSATQVSVTWSYPITTQAPTQFKVERKTSTSSYVTVANVTDATAYFDNALASGETYTYRVTASNFKGVADSAETTTEELPAQTEVEMPFDGIRLWLRADAAGAGYIRRWPDQTNNGNDALQSNRSAEPFSVPNAFADRPALHFSGGQVVGLPDVMNSASAGEMFVVVRADPYDSGTVRGFMRFGNNGDNAHFPIYGGVIADNFGTTVRKDSAGVPLQDLSQYLLYDVASTSTQWTSRINGIPYYSTADNVVGFSSAPQIGLSQGWYFAGDIAEILIYDYALSEEQRIAVGHYLASKYPALGGPSPTTPSNLAAHSVSGTQNYLGWTYSLSNFLTTFVVERSQSGGPFTEVARVRNRTSFLDCGLVPETQYSYRLKAIGEAGESGYCAVASAETAPVGGDIPLTGIRLWLSADSIAAGPVQSWLSQGSDSETTMALQGDPTRRPTLTAGALHGRPVVHFNGAQSLALEPLMTGAAAGEMFVVMRCDPYDASTIRGFMRFGSNGDNAHYPISGSIADNFGSTTRQGGSNLALEDLSQYHIYSAVSTGTEWTNRINGILNYTTGTNAVGFSNSPQIGLSQGYYFAGDIAELIVYDHALTAGEEAAVQKYLAVKYTILDPDNDGLDGDQELAIGTDPNNWDTNGNGLADGAEYFAGYDPTSWDTDGDGLTNSQELVLGTDPFLADTDRDGVPDAQDAFPLDPTRSALPGPGDPNDHTPPTVTLTEPAGATLLP